MHLDLRAFLQYLTRKSSLALVVTLLSMATWSTAPLECQSAKQPPLGAAWNVRGVWHEGAAPGALRTGAPLLPGALLEPEPSASEHSLTILLPDGQRVLYECFTTEDCARGFRVPSLYVKPDEFAVDLLARIRAVLTRPNGTSKPSPQSAPDVPQDEVVAVLGAGNEINVGGLASSLEHGRYGYAARSLGEAAGSQVTRTVDKTSRNLSLVLPRPGLYDVLISDSEQRPRIDLLVAAISASQTGKVQQSFEHAHAIFADWNEDYQGWPVHAFQRAFLTSLMLGIGPRSEFKSAAIDTRGPEVTAEPHFSPAPGAFKTDTAVALHADTPGAVIHFTVDGSQPFLSSPVYEAPIMVKGTELTIKAFASAPEKKDSPVVTGIFKIVK